jgi:chromosome segregation ATPase
LRRERIVYDNIHKKLEVELKKKKDEMMKIIDKAEKAYFARETAKQEMTELKKEAEKEQEEFEAEWNKLGKLIEKDKQVKDFIKTQEETKTGAKPGDTMHSTEGGQGAERGTRRGMNQTGSQSNGS